MVLEFLAAIFFCLSLNLTICPDGGQFLQSDAEFIKLIGELGPAPPAKKKGSAGGADAGDDGEGAANSAANGEERTLDLVDIGLRNLLENSSRFDTSVLEAAKFFYRRGTTKAGHPVFYFILHRFPVPSAYPAHLFSFARLV